MALLMVLSVGSLVFFPSGSYLFYLPLLATALTAFFRRRSAARLAAGAVSGVAVLLLWVPVVFLLWVAMIQPMFL
ncbi:MAG: hypothetical protein LBR72_08210, partial [Oscillospiraceae bacterium]|jgi:hypothetical protein|nr:hypothetical protein [Oscillospiraceae bacterium]